MALGEILSFEAWLAGPGRNTVTWPADRQRKAYNSYVSAQQKYLAGQEAYRQEFGAYRAAYQKSREDQLDANVAFKKTHVAKVSGSVNLRRDVNDWFRSKGLKKDRFPEGELIQLTPGPGTVVDELTAWGNMFRWLKKKDKNREARDRNEYNGMINYGNGSPMDLWQRARIGAVAEAPEKVRTGAGSIWTKFISKSVAARADLPPEFYAAAVKETRAREIATGKARPAGTGPGSPAGAGTAPATGATVGGYSLTTILIILVIVGLVGYGIYYVATQ